MKTQQLSFALVAALVLTFGFSNAFAATAAPIANATLRVSGQPHASQIFQQVKAMACAEPTKSSQQLLQTHCQKPIYFNLNTDQAIPAGDYILGFSDTVYPGFVHLNPGDQREIKLENIPLPAAGADDTVRAFINFGSVMEQRKVYFSVYYTAEHFFKLAEYSFDDLFLTTVNGKNIFSPFDQRSCTRIQSDSGASDFAKILCDDYRKANSMMDLADFFLFETKAAFDGQYQEAFIWFPGDIFSVRYKRNLIALPLNGAAIAPGDSLAVFPGSYKVEVKRGKTVIQSSVVNTNDMTENYSATQLARNIKPRVTVATAVVAPAPPAVNTSQAPSFFIDTPSTTTAAVTSASDNDQDSCLKARMWRTENRSYCTSDQADGCKRQTAKLCEVTNIIDFRFRVN